MSQQIPRGAIDLSSLIGRSDATPAVPTSAAPTPAGAAPGTGAGAQQEGRIVDVPSVVLDATDQTFEQVMQLSQVVPIVIDLWAEWCQPCKTLTPILEKVTRESSGRVVLAKVDVDSNPGLAQAFKAQSIPTVVALVAGQPVPMFQGAVPEAQVREVFEQLFQLAAQQGVTGRVQSPDLDGAAPSQEPTEPQINPDHEAALEAIERGDYDAAVTEYEAVLNRAPADEEARAALVQVKLLSRLEGASAEEIRANAAAEPQNLDAQFRVADLDVSGGHIEDAFLRLLELFESSDDEARGLVREHLLELFEVVGPSDARVISARGRLSTLLF